MTFKKNLARHMKSNGYNPTSLARKMRVNVTFVRDILQHPGNPHPRIDTFLRLCKVLKVTPEQLYSGFKEVKK